MGNNDRRDTDAIARPIDISKIVPKVRPWTKEEAAKAKQEYKQRMLERAAQKNGAANMEEIEKVLKGD